MLGAEPSRGDALSGDFAGFCEREYPAVVRLTFVLTGRSDLAEDMTQDSFLIAQRRWERISGYDDPGAWVRRVATNRCVSGFRKAGAELGAMTRLQSRRSEPVELPEQDAELWAAVRSLPRRQAQVLALMYVEDRAPNEIASLLKLSEDTVRTHARRGRLALAEKLGLHTEEEETR